MSKKSPSVIPNNTTLELIKIFERIREILRFTGTDETIATMLRISPVSEFQRDPIMCAMYNRGVDDWTAGVNLVYDPPNIRTLRILFPDANAQPIIRAECSINDNQTQLSEHDYQELEDLRERCNILLETEGNLALERIAVVVSLYPMTKIRNDPILFAAYIRGWEDRGIAAVRNNFRR